MDKDTLARLTADVVSSYVGNSSLSEGELDRAIERLPVLIGRVHEALSRILADGETDMSGSRQEASQPALPNLPAVPVSECLQSDHIVCLEDGKRFKTLSRHLRQSHGMSPEEYRAKWGLPADFPMICDDYAKERSAVAKRIGLGVEGRGSTPAYVKAKPKRRPSKNK